MNKIKQHRHYCKTCEFANAVDATIFCNKHKYTMSWMSGKGCKDWKMRGED